MFDLSGKKALVTGASGAIGGAIARALHGQGATVALHGSRKDALDALAGELKERTHIAVANLSAGDEVVEKLIPDVEAALGQIDILVNNAGITRDGLAMRMKDEDFAQVIGINLAVPFRLSRAVIRGMMKRRWGRIINISSVVGATGNAGQTNYVASKAGLIGLTKSLAQEVASRGITVNAIAPGLVASAMTDKLNDEQQAKFLAGIPVGRVGEGPDIAAAAVYLASNEASYVTGQTLHVNGGMAMI